MKKTLIAFILVFSFIYIYSQDNSNTKSQTSQKQKLLKKQEEDFGFIALDVPKGIKIRNVQENNNNFWLKNFPWISALIVGLGTLGVNLYVAHMLQNPIRRIY